MTHKKWSGTNFSDWQQKKQRICSIVVINTIEQQKQLLLCSITASWFRDVSLTPCSTLSDKNTLSTLVTLSSFSIDLCVPIQQKSSSYTTTLEEESFIGT